MPHTKLRYHVITATKYRLPLITSEIEGLLHGTVDEKANELNCKIICAGNTEDHIHLIVAIRPPISISRFVRTIKSVSTLAVKTSGLDDNFQWQNGYGAFTLNPYDMAGIIKYVSEQKWHHSNNNLWEPYEITSE